MCRTKIYCVLGNKLSLSETVNWYTSLPLGAVQTGVLWPCAPLESVASSVEKAAELRLSSLTDCLCPGPGRGTLLAALCTSLVFGGTSVVFEGTPVVLEDTLLAFAGALSEFGGMLSLFKGTSVVFGGISLGERGSEELVVITEKGLVPLEGPCETSGPCWGASDSLFKGDPFF